jgi:hypothetical protein
MPDQCVYPLGMRRASQLSQRLQTAEVHLDVPAGAAEPRPRLTQDENVLRQTDWSMMKNVRQTCMDGPLTSFSQRC